MRQSGAGLWAHGETARRRRTLCLGTALATTLAGSVTFGAGDARADIVCFQPPAPAPIAQSSVNDNITCINVQDRANALGDAIALQTASQNITANNSGALSASGSGISANSEAPQVSGADASEGDVTGTDDVGSAGSDGGTGGAAIGGVAGIGGAAIAVRGGDVDLTNSGPIVTSAADGAGIFGRSVGGDAVGGAASVGLKVGGDAYGGDGANGAYDQPSGAGAINAVGAAGGAGGNGGQGGPAIGGVGGIGGNATSGAGGNVTIRNGGVIQAGGTSGIVGISAGGAATGGAADVGRAFGGRGDGGDGGDGGGATATSSGSTATATGGNGGAGGSGNQGGSAVGGVAGTGGAATGGSAGIVDIGNGAGISTTGTGAQGIFASGMGGQATGGSASTTGATGGSANGGNAVFFDASGGNATAEGSGTTEATGGTGGAGGNGGRGAGVAGGVAGIGGTGTGGDAGIVRVDNTGDIETAGLSAHAIRLLGMGGDGIGGAATTGLSTGGDADGGHGGGGGDANAVSLDGSASATAGTAARGGNGGTGGSAAGGLGGVGGMGTGGAGATIDLTNSGDLVTTGASAVGLFLVTSGGQGIGGAADSGGVVGGNAHGGDADFGASAVARGEDSATARVSINGQGGNGGTGGSAAGGVGGDGGAGIGGAGGGIEATNRGDVTTSGDFASGIAAASAGGRGAGGSASGGGATGGDAIGGGAGSAGNALVIREAAAGSIALQVTISAAGANGGAAGAAAGGVGGDGGAATGGAGGSVGLTNFGTILASGSTAVGVSVLSSGGAAGGGAADGGAATGGSAQGGQWTGSSSYTTTEQGSGLLLAVAASIGSSGGVGGSGGDVSGGSGGRGGAATGGAGSAAALANLADVTTSGNGSHALQAGSLGAEATGGGANGGVATGGDSDGGGGRNGGSVTMTLTSSTQAFISGGGGGTGGNGGVETRLSEGGGNAVGGTGGQGGAATGGAGMAASVANLGDLSTGGDGAHGIYAVSRGGSAVGGSANGGSSTGGSADGGAGGDGGEATGTASASGEDIRVRAGEASRGGNGGEGGDAVGGAGGIGGNGRGGDAGIVTVNNAGDIRTLGAGSHGIYALSQGGDGTGGSADGGAATGGSADGGAGGAGGNATLNSSNPAAAYFVSPSGGGRGGDGGTGGDAVGGSGGTAGNGTGGNGGNVTVRNAGNIEALGAGSHGILAVSAGGTGTGGTAAGGIGTGGTAAGGQGGAAGVATGPQAGTGTVETSIAGTTGTAGDAGTGVNGVSGIAGVGTNGAGGSVLVENAGQVLGTASGITTLSGTGTTIRNSGRISSSNLLAIDVDGAAGTVENTGLVVGYVDLTDEADSFTNMDGGVFQARLTSDFGAGNDTVVNRDGALILTAVDGSIDENVFFVNLETLQNFGTISMIDGGAGDRFTIANTLGGTGLDYSAASGLGVDVFLGGAGSPADVFRVDGNVSGLTHVTVNNTGGAGSYNPDGITVVEVRGSVAPDAFELEDGPIDAGLFTYDLFYEPRNGGTFDTFELRSFAGAGAFVLPQLVTAAQDIWHVTSDTWFDRAADLRSEMRGEAQGDGSSSAPAFWIRASYNEIDRDGGASVSAYGRSYAFDLDRDLDVVDVLAGADLSFDGVFAPEDRLIVSAFGGYVSADLDYRGIGRSFDVKGGQAGVAATYLNGGLFVDALFNAQFLKYDTTAIGYDDLDANNYGFRVDTGYRIDAGSFFIEPMATLAYVRSDLDGYAGDGNDVSFDDGHNLRGRLAIRAGTSVLTDNFRIEPFAIASLWGNLSGTPEARIVSGGETFTFGDSTSDVWGQVSLGMNVFSAQNGNVSSFIKGDAVFGDDLSGWGVRGGLRVKW